MIALAIAALLGWFAVRLWLPRPSTPAFWTHLLHFSLGIALGCGAVSCLYFLLLIAGLAKFPIVAGIEAVALLALAAAHTLRPTPESRKPLAAQPTFRLTWILAAAALVMLAIFIAAFLNSIVPNPQGGWDAFAIWNLRAQYLTQSETWRYAVTSQPTGTHMEYPLLLSSLIAHGWLFDSMPSSSVPIAVALVIPLALALLLAATLSSLRGPAAGLLAVTLLLANPILLAAAPDQYADLPLAFFGLASAALLSLDRSPRYLTLAGVLASFAAWTKNEGLLLLLALCVALIVTTSLRHGVIFLAGALPVLSLDLWFKLSLAPPDPLAAAIAAGHLHTIPHVAAGFIKGAPAIPLLLLALTAALLRFRPIARTILLPAIAAVILLSGDFAVFLLSRDDVDWLLSTALPRLYLQLWPLVILSLFLLLRSPEDFAIALPPTKSRRTH